MKEYGLNYIGLHIRIEAIYSLIKGYWALWGLFLVFELRGSRLLKGLHASEPPKAIFLTGRVAAYYAEARCGAWDVEGFGKERIVKERVCDSYQILPSISCRLGRVVSSGVSVKNSPPCESLKPTAP